jgi:drug/metabolite transporter (DMT)-like permease
MKAFVYLSFATLAFSSMELAGKLVAGHLTSLQVTFLRFFIGFLMLLPFAYLEGKKRGIRLTRSDVAWLTLLGVCNIVIAMVLLQQAVTMIPASLAAILISSNPLFVVIFASLILHEKVTVRTVIGLASGIFGLVLVTNVLHSVSSVNVLGLLCGLGAAFFFGLYTVLSKKVVKRLGGMITNVGSFFIGSMLLLIILLVKGEPVLQGLNGTTLWPVLYLGLIVTGFAYICFLHGLSLIDASKGAIIFFFKPIVASLLAFFILHETLGMNVIVGTAFVVGGSAIMVLKRPDKPRQAEVAK